MKLRKNNVRLVQRGCSFKDAPWYLRYTFLSWGKPEERYENNGFRFVIRGTE